MRSIETGRRCDQGYPGARWHKMVGELNPRGFGGNAEQPLLNWESANDCNPTLIWHQVTRFCIRLASKSDSTFRGLALSLNRKTPLINVRQSVFSETGAVWARTQPHVVMLAELQYRAARSAASRNATLHRLSPLVFATASFLAGFAERRGESKAIFETRRSMLWLTLSVGSQRVPAGRTESSSISRRR